jgi:hypothetical protein
MAALTASYFSKIYHMTESKGQGLCLQGLQKMGDTAQIEDKNDKGDSESLC